MALLFVFIITEKVLIVFQLLLANLSISPFSLVLSLSLHRFQGLFLFYFHSIDSYCSSFSPRPLLIFMLSFSLFLIIYLFICCCCCCLCFYVGSVCGKKICEKQVLASSAADKTIRFVSFFFFFLILNAEINGS